MKRIVSLLCFLSCLIAFQACTKDADVKLPVVESKLVLSCFLSPQDTAIYVRVSLSRPIYNNPDTWQTLPVPDATVVLSTGSKAVTLSYDAGHTYYVISASLLKISAGNTYHLSVSTPDGKFVQAFTTIPAFNNTFSATVNADPNKPDNYFFHGVWQDPAGAKDYYRLELYTRMGSAFSDYYELSLITDRDSDGSIIRRDWEFQRYSQSTDSVFASLCVLSPELYEYLDRFDKVFTGIDLFSEPVPMYTNIEGGFGIFGGYNRNRVKVLP